MGFNILPKRNINQEWQDEHADYDDSEYIDEDDCEDDDILDEDLEEQQVVWFLSGTRQYVLGRRTAAYRLRQYADNPRKEKEDDKRQTKG